MLLPPTYRAAPPDGRDDTLASFSCAGDDLWALEQGEFRMPERQQMLGEDAAAFGVLCLYEVPVRAVAVEHDHGYFDALARGQVAVVDRRRPE